jgi:hypothetical protein
MRALLLASLLAASAVAQTGPLGLFTSSEDVGGPPLKGSAEYDPATRQYKITGTGVDIFGRKDEFRYTWREMSGNFSVTTTTKFLTDGIAHRKASIMLRKTADGDSPFIHLAIHGDGMTSVQFRNVKAGLTNTLDFPIGTPGIWTLKLTRQGTAIIVYTAKEGEQLTELGRTQNSLGSPVLVGFAVASHSQQALNTVLFSNVSIEQTPPPAPAAR